MRSSRLRAALLLTLLCLGCRVEPFDAADLHVVSPLAVIQAATVRFQVLWIERGAARADDLRALACLPAGARTLAWLAVIDSKLTIPDSFEPAIVFDGQFKDQMGDALAAAGMEGRAVLFRKATAGIAAPAIKDDAWGSGGDVVRLGEAFEHKRAFQADMLRFAARDPEAAAWVAQRRAALSDEDRLHALEGALMDQPGYATAAMSGWPEPYRTIALADIYQSEKDNGSLHQFFLNSSGDVAPQARDAMLVLGLAAHAEAIAKGMAFFPKPYPVDRTARFRAFHHRWGDWDERLGALTLDDGAIDPALIGYAKRHDILPR